MGLILLAGVSLGQACSIKEDRTPCPCLLTLDFNCPDVPEARSVGLQVTSQGNMVWKDTVDVDRTRNGYSISVPRSALHVRAWIGTSGLATEAGLVIPLGKDCPEVYMHDSDIRASGEYVYETVTLRKNHCVLTLTTEGDGHISTGMRLRGNIAGYDAVGQPLCGEFEFPLKDGGISEGYKAVLPRQTDASLMLEIEDGKGDYKAFALGRYIVSSGYDWSSPDLEDISVTLDYALTEVRLVINGWESVYRYDIEI